MPKGRKVHENRRRDAILAILISAWRALQSQTNEHNRGRKEKSHASLVTPQVDGTPHTMGGCKKDICSLRRAAALSNPKKPARLFGARLGRLCRKIP